MKNIILSQTKLGLVQLDWTFLFQIVNTLLWILIIFAIYRYIKKAQAKKQSIEERVTKLEREVEKLNK